MSSRNNRTRRPRSKEGKSSAPVFAVIFLSASIGAAGVSHAVIGADFLSLVMTTAANAAALIKQEAAQAMKQMQHMYQSVYSYTNSTVESVYRNANSLSGSIKVATAQQAQSSQTLAEVQTRAAQTTATARQTIHMQDQLVKMMRQYGSTGQGYKACVVLVENKGLDQSLDNTKVLAAQKETETLSASSPKSDLNSSVTNSTSVSQSELCSGPSTECKSTSKVPNGHVNGALLFTATAPNSQEALARTMFRQNVVGVNLQGLSSPAIVSSPVGQNSYFQSTRLTSLLSPAAYSLAYIDAQNTKSVERDGVMYSNNELIEKTVGRYYGGEESKTWQASMIVQEPRGLLVEAARLGGLTVWLNNHMYQQNLRKEANLASILIATASPLAEQVRQEGNRTEAKALVGAIPLYK